MRKMLWGCGAAAVVVLGAGCLVVGYAYDHPTSWLGRCLVTTHHVAASEAHAVRSTQHAAEVALSTAKGLPGTGAAGEEGGDRAAHAAPAPEEACPVAPAVLPGGVVMHEDGALPAQPMPPVRDVIGALPFLGAVDEFEEARMPPVEDDAPKMPRVPGDDDGHRKTSPKDGGPIFPKMPRDGDHAPRHPRVDAPEIRPSDLWFLPVMPF